MQTIILHLDKEVFEAFHSETDNLYKREITKSIAELEMGGQKVVVLPQGYTDSIELSPNKILVFYVDVGDMAPHKAQTYLESIKSKIDIPGTVIYLSQNTEGRGSYVDVITVSEKERLVFFVDVGDMSVSTATAYLEQIREQMNRNLPEIKNISYIPVPKDSGTRIRYIR